MTTLVLTEKPSVARDIARVLDVRGRRDGFLEGNGYVVTWAVGHLVGLAQPHEIDPAWKAWSRASLPMLPKVFPLVVLEDGRDQYAVVDGLVRDPRIESIIAATDAGREGELIFRYIVERSGVQKPWKRLWISSLTDEAIREGFRRLEPGTRYDGLADAAKGRSRADWLVGMNLSRLYSIGQKDLFTVGRVQTPTLAMIVDRDRAIRDFVPEPYVEVEAGFAHANGVFKGLFHRIPNGPDALRTKDGRVRLPKAEAARLPADRVEADAIAARASGARATLELVEQSAKRTPPPFLYDLTELQRDGNRLFGLTAKQTLDAAQTLYERHKVLSYPRTDSRHLSADVAKTMPPIVKKIASRYADVVDASVLGRPLGKRFVDDAKVSDHHAIVPTGELVSLPEGSAEAKIFDLVCRRLLMALHPDRIEAITTVVATVETNALRDRYVTKGVAVEALGWSVLDRKVRSPKPAAASADAGSAGEAVVPPGLAVGDTVDVASVRVVEKKTQPPKSFTEGTLLTAMETAGKTLDEKELAQAMRESGLGTPATRAAILETLVGRGYIVRDGKSLRVTPKGEALVDAVHEHVRSPAMTGEWELRLKRMERGEESLDAFMRDIERYVADVVGDSRPPESGAGAPTSSSTSSASSASSAPRSAPPRAGGLAERPSSITPRPPVHAAHSSHEAWAGAPAPRTTTAPDELHGLLKQRFGFDAFRRHQEEICRAVTSGTSALVVMPTGAGKSLCYQLPGLARGGTTLVVSPLIALIEDQVAKLRANGLVAERIHSGMDRLSSREVCARYLRGELDFFFIAPERLAVPGFPEMLAKRPPVLVAIDEAHCISQWGHDFRPDYRMLRERLELLRGVPTLALTATATPLVQADILAQLGIAGAKAFIFGFRRTNLAIEVVDVGRADRAALTFEILRPEGRRPAIVYAPTRKEAEATADVLSKKLRSATYHAGMSADARARVQQGFIDGTIDVMVATVAFGMGIDKADVRTVVHTALPASVEGYYQEIGRAGRDGAPSRALLLFGGRDRRTHEFFLERDYPETAYLEKIVKALGKSTMARDSLTVKFRADGERFDKALEKLWIHGGVVVDSDDVITRGNATWKAAYEKQRAHKVEAIERMLAFAGSSACRMRSLVRHFGDADDDGTLCGICDVCAPADIVLARQRGASDAELAVVEDLIAQLESRDGQSLGKLFESVGEGRVERSQFEALLAAAARVGVLSVDEQSFEREGRRIVYRAAFLGPRASDWLDESVRSELTVVDLESYEPKGRTRRARPKAKASGAATVRATRTRTPRADSRDRDSNPDADGSTSADARVVEALRTFRRDEAKRLGVPPFVVFSDRDLYAIAEAGPTTEDALRELRGFGPKRVAKYGTRILRVLREASS